MAEDVAGAVSDAVSGVAAELNGLGADALEFLRPAADALRDTVAAVTKAVADAVGRLPALFKSAVGGILDALKPLLDGLKSVGLDIGLDAARAGLDSLTARWDARIGELTKRNVDAAGRLAAGSLDLIDKGAERAADGLRTVLAGVGPARQRQRHAERAADGLRTVLDAAQFGTGDLLAGMVNPAVERGRETNAAADTSRAVAAAVESALAGAAAALEAAAEDTKAAVSAGPARPGWWRPRWRALGRRPNWRRPTASGASPPATCRSRSPPPRRPPPR